MPTTEPNDDLQLKRRDLRSRRTIGSHKRAERKKTRQPLLPRVWAKLRSWFFPQNIHDLDDQNPWERRIALTVAALLMGGFATLAVVGARPTKNWLDGKQAERKSEKLQSYLDQGLENLDPEEQGTITELSRDIFEEREAYPMGLVVIGEMAIETRNQSAPIIWEEIERKKIISPRKVDHGLGRAYVIANRLEEASAIADRLIASYPTDRDYLELARQVASARGNIAKTVAMIDRLEASGDLENEVRLQRAILGLESQMVSGNQHNQALADIWEIAWTKGRLGLAAIEFLDSKGDELLPSQRSQLGYLLESHPMATHTHKVAALDYMESWYPGYRRERLEELIAESIDWPTSKLAIFTSWLNERGFYLETVRVLEPHEGRALGHVIQQKCDALLQLGRIQELKDTIRADSSSLTTADRKLYLAHLEIVTDQRQHRASGSLRESMKEAKASSNPNQLIRISQYATTRGFYEVAEEGLREALKLQRKFASIEALDTTRKAAANGLLNLASSKGDSDLAIEALTILTKLEEQERVTRKLVYLRLLSGDQMESMFDIAQRSVLSYPNEFDWDLNLAIAYYRMGDDDRCREILSKYLEEADLPFGKGKVFSYLASEVGLTPKIQSNVERRTLFDVEIAFVGLDESPSEVLDPIEIVVPEPERPIAASATDDEDVPKRSAPSWVTDADGKLTSEEPIDPDAPITIPETLPQSGQLLKNPDILGGIR